MVVGHLYAVVDDAESGASEAAATSLQEPLLPHGSRSSSFRPVKDQEEEADAPRSMSTISKQGTWTVPFHRIKLLSLVTGSLVAVASQLILSQVLWKPSHLTTPSFDYSSPSGAAMAIDGGTTTSARGIVAFSLLWSFCTCVMIFGSMAIFVRCVCRSLFRSLPGGNKTVDDATTAEVRADLDGDLFQIEAHHIVGSLLSISFIWIVVDVCQSLSQQHGGGWSDRLGLPTLHQNVVYMVIAVAWYAAFVRCIVQRQSHDGKVETESGRSGGLMSTYQMIAATLGLISGLCSQFLLSFVLWKDHMSKPVIENVIVFSILWSVCSVFLTFVGCVSLRLLTLDETNRLSAERIFLRMESHFIFCSLIGICLAWILIDLIMDMREQIVPSVLMLAVSLLAFCGIVSCFPEDKCLADLQDASDIQLTESSGTTALSSSSLSTASIDGIPVIQIV